MTRQGLRSQFHDLKPKSNETFLDYATEVQLVFKKWLAAAEINGNFQLLKDLTTADKILSSVLGKMASFMKEQRADSQKQIYEIRTAYYDAKRDIFSIYNNPHISVGASSKMGEKSHWSKFKPRFTNQNGLVKMVTSLNANFTKKSMVRKRCVMKTLKLRNLYSSTSST